MEKTKIAFLAVLAFATIALVSAFGVVVAGENSEEFLCSGPQSHDEPVCGWYDPGQVQCFREPCANDYVNSETACSDETILYYTLGNCPYGNLE